jgi:hypothetical protein
VRRALLGVIALAALPGLLGAQEVPLLRGDSLLPFRGGTILWVHNPGRDTVWVDTLFLRGCQNLAEPCGSLPLGIPIPPGEGRRLHRVRPKITRDAYHYRWTFVWHVVVMTPDEEDSDTTR